MFAIRRGKLHKVNHNLSFYVKPSVKTNYLQHIISHHLEPGNMTSMNNAARKEEEQRIQRAAEREGRRTRRRRGRAFFDLF